MCKTPLPTYEHSNQKYNSFSLYKKNKNTFSPYTNLHYILAKTVTTSSTYGLISL